MNAVDRLIIIDIPTKIVFTLDFVLICLTLILFKIALGQINQQFQQKFKEGITHLKKPQIQLTMEQQTGKQGQTSKNQFTKIIRKYSFFQCCFNSKQHSDRCLNYLLLLACFCAYYLIIEIKIFPFPQACKKQSQEIVQTILMGVCQLLFYSVSAVWVGVIFMGIDKIFCKILQRKQKQINKDQQNNEQVTKAIRNLKVIYAFLQVLIILGILLYFQSIFLSTPYSFIFNQSITLTLLLNHNSTKIVLLIPFLLINQQLVVLLFSSICFLFSKLLTKNSMNRVHNDQVKFTTTMNIMGDESNENLETKEESMIYHEHFKNKKSSQGRNINFVSMPPRKKIKRSSIKYRDNWKMQNKQYQYQSPKSKKQEKPKSFFYTDKSKDKQEEHQEELYRYPFTTKQNVLREPSGDSSVSVSKQILKNGLKKDKDKLQFKKGERPSQFSLQSKSSQFQGYQFKDLGVVKNCSQSLPRANKYLRKQKENNSDRNLKHEKIMEKYQPSYRYNSGPIVYASPQKKNNKFCLYQIQEAYLKE